MREIWRLELQLLEIIISIFSLFSDILKRAINGGVKCVFTNTEDNQSFVFRFRMLQHTVGNSFICERGSFQAFLFTFFSVPFLKPHREKGREYTMARRMSNAKVPKPAAAVVAEQEAARVKKSMWRPSPCLRWSPWARVPCR